LLTLYLLLLKSGLGVKLSSQAPVILIAGQYKVSERYHRTIISSEQSVILARVLKGRVKVFNLEIFKVTVQNENFLRRESAPIDLLRSRVGTRKHSLYRKIGKRVLDVVLVMLAAPIVLPTVLILAAFVASDGCNPFFRQKRVGRNGRIFTMWKLRTMVPNADQKLQDHLDACEKAREEWEVKQKLTEDPRITTFGHAIRKTSMDELPQLWNVLKGDMSLVGPRPMMPEQATLYPGRAYFYLRPGVSGFWQISDRNNSSFAARADYDEMYNRRLSLSTDTWVILKTLSVVMRGTGC
jgi:lipopolysaccharide/colanic/teichoic acid biosynthesis glycosyltransferase